MQELIYQDEKISFDEFINRSINEVLPKEDGLMVEIHRDEIAFELLKTYWEDLAEKVGATMYMSPQWAQAWWKHFGKREGRSLFLITLWQRSELIALAPMYREESRVGNRLLESRLRLIGSGGSKRVGIGFKDDYGISDFLDVLVDPNHREQVAQKLMHLIESSYMGVDRLYFDQARDDSFVMTQLYPLLKDSLLKTHLEHTDTCPYIDLTGIDSLKAYIKEQKSNARRRLRQTLRAEGEEGDFVYEEPKSWEEVESAIDTVIELHQNRWNELGFPGVFYEKRFGQFFREIVRTAYDNGWLWFKQARDAEGICASRMIIRYQNRYFDYISGFDDNRDSARRRPGIGLLLELVNDAITQEIDRVELLRGEEGYKYDFTDKNFKNWQVSVQLREPGTISQKWVQSTLHGVAYGYKYAKSELRLMNVQRISRGLLRMLPGYLQFRWQSVKLKFQ
jgi:CelD/BcsL family acetyltransferase involved in cellulose biosynthesis